MPVAHWGGRASGSDRRRRGLVRVALAALLLALIVLVLVMSGPLAGAQGFESQIRDEPKLQRIHRALLATPAGDLFGLIAERFSAEYLGFLYELQGADERGDAAAGFKLGSELVSTVQARNRRHAKHAPIPAIVAKIEAEIDLVNEMLRLAPASCRSWVTEAFVPNLPAALHPVNLRHTMRFFTAMADGRDRPIDHGELTDEVAAVFAKTLERAGVPQSELDIVAGQGWDRLEEDREVCEVYARFLGASLATPQPALAPVLATLLSE